MPPLRLFQLYAGLALYGLSSAMMIRADLGLDPWNVLHQGLAQHLRVSIGVVIVGVGAVLMLAWIPLRQWPGIGTVSNVALVGVFTDVFLRMIPSPADAATQVSMLFAAIGLNGIAGGMYIGAGLGPGPRDGLMTGLAKRLGRSIRVTRTLLEAAVLAVGWLLGGTVGIGTILYAACIGAIVHKTLSLQGDRSRS